METRALPVEAGRESSVFGYGPVLIRGPAKTQPMENIMYAVVITGGKQYRVEEGQTLKVEKLEIATGGAVELEKVLLIGNGDDVKIGTPVVEGAKVTAEVIAHGRHKKVKILKFKRRKHHMKQMGHRQWFTELKITSIAG
jgi:large subunit ribosomal protein L21